MAEALINYWTIEHLFFGLGVAVIVTILSMRKHRILLTSFFILSLWEIFEYKNIPGYWINNVGNNVMDVIVGLIGVYIVIWVSKIMPK